MTFIVHLVFECSFNNNSFNPSKESFPPYTNKRTVSRNRYEYARKECDHRKISTKCNFHISFVTATAADLFYILFYYSSNNGLYVWKKKTSYSLEWKKALHWLFCIKINDAHCSLDSLLILIFMCKNERKKNLVQKIWSWSKMNVICFINACSNEINLCAIDVI